MDFAKFGRALRLRWMWLAWQDPARPWAQGPLPCDDTDKALFSMATCIVLGDGARTKFWHDRWLNGQCPKIIAPTLYKISFRKNRTVKEAMENEVWLTDLANGLTEQMTLELTTLASLLEEIGLQQGQPDLITWRLSPDGKYSASSAYLLQFEGSIPMDGYQLIWSAWAPGKCRFFIWTAILGKILTADALLRRGWENNYFCPLCERSLETSYHLLVDCPWSKDIWDSVASTANFPSLRPATWSGCSDIKYWMSRCFRLAPAATKKSTLSLIQLTTWEIWRERNRRLFQQEAMHKTALVRKIKDEIRLWNMAGAGIPFDPG